MQEPLPPSAPLAVSSRAPPPQLLPTPHTGGAWVTRGAEGVGRWTSVPRHRHPAAAAAAAAAAASTGRASAAASVDASVPSIGASYACFPWPPSAAAAGAAMTAGAAEAAGAAAPLAVATHAPDGSLWVVMRDGSLWSRACETAADPDSRAVAGRASAHCSTFPPSCRPRRPPLPPRRRQRRRPSSSSACSSPVVAHAAAIPVRRKPRRGRGGRRRRRRRARARAAVRVRRRDGPAAARDAAAGRGRGGVGPCCAPKRRRRRCRPRPLLPGCRRAAAPLLPSTARPRPSPGLPPPLSAHVSLLCARIRALPFDGDDVAAVGVAAGGRAGRAGAPRRDGARVCGARAQRPPLCRR